MIKQFGIALLLTLSFFDTFFSIKHWSHLYSICCNCCCYEKFTHFTCTVQLAIDTWLRLPFDVVFSSLI